MKMRRAIGIWAVIATAFLAAPLLALPADADLAVALRADVEVLAGEIGPRQAFAGSSLVRAADFVERRLAGAGWQVRRQRFEVPGATCANLEVERRGTAKPDEIVVIGAHYDTVRGTPGADDNASGVAALLALAAEFAPSQPARTVRFVAFANEEPAFFQTESMGSRVYARACRARGEKIVAMVALESIGYYSDLKESQRYPFPLSLFYPSRGNFLAIVGNRESRPLVKLVTKTIRETKAIPCESAALPGSWTGVGWSDHWSFWQEGYPAVMATDTATFRNPFYHRSTDTPGTLDYPRLAAAVRGLQAAVAGLAQTEKR
jgi:hypothetical protein